MLNTLKNLIYRKKKKKDNSRLREQIKNRKEELAQLEQKVSVYKATQSLLEENAKLKIDNAIFQKEIQTYSDAYISTKKDFENVLNILISINEKKASNNDNTWKSTKEE